MRNKKICALWLCIVALCVTAIGAVGLWRVPNLLQYAIPAPTETQPSSAGGEEGKAEEAKSALYGLIESWETQRETLAENLSASAISAFAYGQSFSAEVGGSGSGTLTGVGVGWFDVYPRFLLEGRLIGEAELREGANVVVLDEPLAFAIFQGAEAVGSQLQIGGIWYEVIGVVRHTRQVGDMDAMGAYVPIQRLAQDFVQMDVVTLSGVPIPATGATTFFTEAAGNWRSGGDFYDLSKEGMRAGMIVRLLVVLFAMAVLLFLLKRLLRRVGAGVREWRARLKVEYFRSMMRQVFGSAALWLLGLAAILGAAFALLSLLIEPLYVFTEWVPEVIVEWSSLEARFWELTTAMAKPVKVQTAEYARVCFFGTLLRWGVISALCAVILNLAHRLRARRQG